MDIDTHRLFPCLFLLLATARPMQALVLNGGFELNGGACLFENWDCLGGSLIQACPPCHTGAGCAKILGNATTTSILTQNIHIQSGGRAFASFWYQAGGGDGNNADAAQCFKVETLDKSMRAVPFLRSENGVAGVWQRFQCEISPFQGMDVRLCFSATGSSGHQATLALDDVAVDFFPFSPTVTQSFTASPTFTHTPSCTPTPTVTLTLSASPTSSPSATLTQTPVFSPSPSAAPKGAFLAPVPAMSGQAVCLKAGADSPSISWSVYSLDGALVAQMGTGQPCWDTAGIAPGVYLARMLIGSASSFQKIALVP